MRGPAGEIRGAVDRIDDPDRLALAAGRTCALFADKPVLRKGLREPGMNEALDLAVDLGNEILRPFESDAERVSIEKSPLGERPSFASDRACGEVTGVQRSIVDLHVCSRAETSLRSG